MEIIGRRWSTAGAIIKGFTVLSSFLAVRVDLSEQFPTALRGRGHFSGEAAGRILLWCANSVLPGAIHRCRRHLLRHDRRGGDRRLHPAVVRQRNRRPPRARHAIATGLDPVAGSAIYVLVDRVKAKTRASEPSTVPAIAYSAARFGVNSSGRPLWPVNLSPSSYISKARFFNAGRTEAILSRSRSAAIPG